MKTKRIACLGLFIALAFVLSYVEFLLPLNIGIPGAKVGLANLVVMVALYTLGKKDAALLSFVRVVLVGLTFGNLAMLLYSLAGAILSFLAMLIAKRTKLFSITGVSVLGGVFHNVGQIIVAMLVLETGSLLYYLPFLIVIGTISGVVIGLLSGMITARVGRLFDIK
ncbi:Gx transporter family protein [Pseudobutyrivibrio sp.]|uniref:Gx transporter family protein n=1 Tax=Pseudobutyrivibrio sp. TaxID=2014367 RepID=UPI001B255209|nr:Gx transporter family protein [Pseudobutyrivibrio sp.]MBO5617977.1 Gx transporter family protein [Pseudobutyrivibrio sp.]MBP3263471.1 Gx transporter family protein [Pseudobutyrivibrio sp.]